MIQYIIGGILIALGIFTPGRPENQLTLWIVAVGFIVWGVVSQPDKNK